MSAELDRARAAYARGDDAGVFRETDRLLVNSQHPEILALAANAAMRSGDLPRAVSALEGLHRAQPQNPQFRRLLSTAMGNLGARQFAAGDLASASPALARALTLWPDNPEALFTRARLALDARQALRARDDLLHLTGLQPDDVAAQWLLLQTRIALGSADALQSLQEFRASAGATTVDARQLALALSDAGAADDAAAIASDFDGAQAPVDAADVAYRLAENCNQTQAQAVFHRVASWCDGGKRVPGLYCEIGARLTLPLVYRDHEDLAQSRSRYSAGLDQLLERFDRNQLRRCDPVLEQLAWSNFLLTYQGLDNRELQTRYATFLERALREFAADLCAPLPRRRDGQRRIGFISSAFRSSSIGAYFGAWVDAATRAGHHTVLIQLPPQTDQVTADIASTASHWLQCSGGLRQIAARIRELQLDLAIFPDLGVDGRIGVLAGLRLARVQAMGWGHPDTCGLSTIDAFISPATMEPVGAQQHYREKLCLLPGIGTRYQRPPPFLTQARSVLGLPDGHCYLLPQSAHKVHPDTDAVLASIAARDPLARIVMFQGERPGATRCLQQRIGKAFAAVGADAQRQLVFLPMTDRASFLAICSACEVMVDTPHWSGGNTTIDALLCGLPVVTVAGEFMRGRQSAAMLQQLGLTELVCADAASQATSAISIANDRALRAQISTRIGQGVDGLLEGSAALTGLQQVFEQLLDDTARNG